MQQFHRKSPTRPSCQTSPLEQLRRNCPPRPARSVLDPQMKV
jgi:hypothetical protein